MTETVDKEFLYRKLAQTGRLIAGPLAPSTIERLRAYAAELEHQLAAVEVGKTDAPPD